MIRSGECERDFYGFFFGLVRGRITGNLEVEMPLSRIVEF